MMSSAACCAVETGLLASLVLSTLLKPIVDFVILASEPCGPCKP